MGSWRMCVCACAGCADSNRLEHSDAFVRVRVAIVQVVERLCTRNTAHSTQSVTRCGARLKENGLLIGALAPYASLLHCRA